MGVSVLIQSTLRNSLTAVAGVTLTKGLRSIPTASIRIVDPTGAYLPAVGNQVELQDESIVIFGGSILEVERIRRNKNLTIVETICQCVGYADRLEKRLTGQYQWTGETADVIITEMAYQSLSGDITDTTLVEPGPVIDSFVTDLSNAREFMEAVCNLTGREYYVTPEGKLAYFSPSSNAAPFDISTGANVEKLTTRTTREDFCNAATAKVASVLRDPATESFVGDGSTQSFSVLFPLSAAPTVFVGGIEQTIGVASVDTGKDWYWNDGSTEIRQDSGAAPVGIGIAIDVTYVGIDSIIVSASNGASISARAAAENNSGIYEKLLEINQRLTRADAQAIVDAYVERHAELSTVLTIETNDLIEPDVINIEPGQVLTVSLTGFNAAGTYLVRSVSLQMAKGDQDDYRWKCRIEAVAGPILRNYIDVFRDLTGRGTASGSATIAGGSGGAGTYVYEPAKLTANTTIVAPVVATNGATLTVFIIQGAGPYTISFDSGTFGTVSNVNIGPVENSLTVFSFVGRSDGLWWQNAPALTDL